MFTETSWTILFHFIQFEREKGVVLAGRKSSNYLISNHTEHNNQSKKILRRLTAQPDIMVSFLILYNGKSTDDLVIC